MEQAPFPRRILVLCSGNTCRSPMAATWLRQQRPGWVVLDAGAAPGPSNGLANRVMREQGLLLEPGHGKSWERYRGEAFDAVIVLSPLAAAVVQREAPHWPLIEMLVDDPAAVQGTDAFRLEAYRNTAQQLQERLGAWLKEWTGAESAG
jgi:arsenate reductase